MIMQTQPRRQRRVLLRLHPPAALRRCAFSPTRRSAPGSSPMAPASQPRGAPHPRQRAFSTTRTTAANLLLGQSRHDDSWRFLKRSAGRSLPVHRRPPNANASRLPLKSKNWQGTGKEGGLLLLSNANQSSIGIQTRAGRRSRSHVR